MGAETDRDTAPAQDRLPNGSSPDGPPPGATGIPSEDTDTEPANGSPSVLDLIVAYRRKDRGRYQTLKDEFVKDNGTVQDEYIAVKTQSAAFLTAKRGSVLRWRHSYRIRAYYARALDPELDDAVRKTRFEESRWRPVLSGRSEEIVVTQLFSLIASLLRVQDIDHLGTSPSPDQQKMMCVTADAVKKYLPVLYAFAAGLARRATLQAYFLGMLVGVAVAGLAIWGLSDADLMLGTVPLSLVGNCAAAGGVGAVISVMVRVTNNDNLNIDYERGLVIAVLVGAFRPIIGAVFGGILLIFLKSGLIAVTIAPATLQDITLFYVAVGFLAGFSERWAQDTIVNSAPALGTKARPRRRGRGGANPGEEAPGRR